MRKVLLLIALLLSSLYAKEPLEKVSLQLLWLDQFQFAGYYMAIEKGFYKDAGFEVELKAARPNEDTIIDVINGVTTYGIGRANVIDYDCSGERLTLLAAIFQSDPTTLLTLESSGIESVKDFKNRRLMQTDNLLQTASIQAMLKASGLSLSDLEIVPHSYNIDDLINKKTDIYSAYVSNEPFLLQEKGVKYRQFSPKMDGFDFYSDILYTSTKNVKENYESVKKFREASLKGWQYAFEHIDESVAVILEKYNRQNKSKKSLLFEAKALKKLAYYHTDEIGKLDSFRIQRISDIYKLLGKSTKVLNLDKLLFKIEGVHFSKEEQKYIDEKKFVSYCTQPDALPYSAIRDTKTIGISEGLIELLEKKSGMEFRLVPTKSWKESISKALKRECDVLPIAAYTKEREKYFSFTKSYYKEPIVFVTKAQTNYIVNVKSVLDKEFSVIKGNSYAALLKERYPKLKLHYVDSIEEGFRGVESGKYFAHLGIMMRVAYAMQKNAKFNLKINNQFKEHIEASFAIRNDDKVLVSILRKVADDITEKDIQLIINKWISVHYTKGENYWYYKEIAGVIALFILFLLYREYFLKRKNRELESLKERLQELNLQLETKAFEATQDLEKAQSIAKIGSWILNLKTNEVSWSKETYRIFGVDRANSENLYDAFIARIHPEDLEKVQEHFSSAVESAELYEVKHRLLMDDGSIKYVNEKAEITYDEESVASMAYGTVQDVTEKVKQEIELKKRDQYLLHQSRLAQMGEMLSMIAHQWKQPLSAISSTQITIKTVLELEKYDLAIENQREEFLKFLNERLNKIALYVQNLSDTIQNFSNFYKPRTQKNSFEIRDVIEKADSLIRESMKENGIEISFELAEGSVVDLYENEFIQVLLNIFANAKEQLLEKKIENPHIVLKSYSDKDVVVIDIEDNAGGIASEVIEKIFDPYFSTKLAKNGTGLGLYMSKMIISEYHEGELSVHNTEQGACFRIKLKKSESK